jgi:ankyrin repeat protein
LAEFLVKTTQTGKSQGPFSGSQLKKLAGSGQLRPSYLVSSNGGESWHEATQLSGIEFALPTSETEADNELTSDTGRSDTGTEEERVPEAEANAGFDQDEKYYLSFRPGTGRLQLQVGQKTQITYSHSGWYSNASAGVDFAALDEESEGIKEDESEISSQLFQNILRFVQRNIDHVFVEARQGRTADCGQFDLTQVLTGTELEWSDVVEQSGQPRIAEYATQDEWELAKNEGRAVTVVYVSEDEYVGVIGQFPDAYCRLIFDNPLPASEGWVKGYDDESVIHEASEEKESQGNSTDELFMAVQNNNIAAAESALNNGADIDHQHEELNGNTPILLAISAGNVEMVRLLASHTPDFSITNWEDQFEVWLKARAAGSKEIADILVENGAEEKLDDALTHAASSGLLDLATSMLDEGADSDGNHWGTPPILTAASSGHLDIVELLAERGANIHATKDGMNVYVAAFSRGFFELADRTKELGCKVDDGYVLIHSARFGHLPAVKAIIASGTDVNVRREYLNDQTTAIEQAVTSYEIPEDESHDAETRRIEVVKFLLEHGADSNATDDDGKPVLHLAITNSRSEVVAALIEHGADMSVADKETGCTAFLLAALEGDAKTIAAIFHVGADVSSSDANGNTALHICLTKKDYVDVDHVKALVAFGVPLDATNSDGQSITDVLDEKRNELDDDYQIEQLDEVRNFLLGESIKSLHGSLSKKPVTLDEIAAQAIAFVEILKNPEPAIELFVGAHEQGEDVMTLVSEYLEDEETDWRKVAISVIGAIGFDASWAEVLQERYANEWDEELQGLIRDSLTKHGFELPIDPTTLVDMDIETARKVVSLVTEDDDWLSLNSLTDLSAEVAEVLIEAPCGLLLDQVQSLPEDVIDVLARHQYDLSLNGLLSLGEAAAGSLVSHSQTVYLNGLTDLELPVAKILAQRSGPIVMGGIATMSDEVAQVLANTEALLQIGLSEAANSPGNLALLSKLAAQEVDLPLDGLSSLTPTAAEILATHKTGMLSLGGMTTLSPELAAVLAQYEGETLGLDGLEELSVETATALGTYERILWLDGLQEISGEVAAALAGKQHQLTLNGLQEVSVDVVKALTEHEGELLLNGIMEISDDAAEAISHHRGGIAMTNLEQITPAGAECLKRLEGFLQLQLQYIPEESASILRQHPSFADDDNGEDEG